MAHILYLITKHLDGSYTLIWSGLIVRTRLFNYGAPILLMIRTLLEYFSVADCSIREYRSTLIYISPNIATGIMH